MTVAQRLLKHKQKNVHSNEGLNRYRIRMRLCCHIDMYIRCRRRRHITAHTKRDSILCILVLKMHDRIQTVLKTRRKLRVKTSQCLHTHFVYIQRQRHHFLEIGVVRLACLILQCSNSSGLTRQSYMSFQNRVVLAVVEPHTLFRHFQRHIQQSMLRHIILCNLAVVVIRVVVQQVLNVFVGETRPNLRQRLITAAIAFLQQIVVDKHGGVLVKTEKVRQPKRDCQRRSITMTASHAKKHVHETADTLALNRRQCCRRRSRRSVDIDGAPHMLSVGVARLAS
mmetsp:Transcript_43245/g.71448  ORF Transcript_43245/g.71448 Transcript_43245/m.71448 type:complete len:282 (-) Transcript_43245:274-1119(-)